MAAIAIVTQTPKHPHNGKMAVEWMDEAIVLDAQAHGESAAVAHVLTQTRGRYAGLVHGGQGRKARPMLQPGNRVRVQWRARLAEHLGAMTLEPLTLRAGTILDDAARLTGVSAVCALARLALPEREPHQRAHDGLEVLLAHMPNADDTLWPALMVRWEAGLLSDLGYGLDVSRCAVSGVETGLTHVSPSSGRAVDAGHPDALPYRDKLLPLPGFLIDPQAAICAQDIADGFALTGWFLERRVLWPADRTLPEARTRLLTRIQAHLHA